MTCAKCEYRRFNQNSIYYDITRVGGQATFINFPKMIATDYGKMFCGCFGNCVVNAASKDVTGWYTFLVVLTFLIFDC